MAGACILLLVVLALALDPQPDSGVDDPAAAGWTGPEPDTSRYYGAEAQKGSTLSPLPQLPKHRTVKKELRQVTKRAQVIANNVPLSIRVGSFNVLGTQHTAPGGSKPGRWASGPARIPGAVERIRAHGVDVVGLQEVQMDQMSGILNGTGWTAYPGLAGGKRSVVNSILWNPEVFELVSGSTFDIPIGGFTRPQAIVRLRHRATGRELYVVNAHPPAGHDGRTTGLRYYGFSRIVAQVNALKAQGLPVFLTGDMNDRAPFFCRVLPPTGMIASVGGSTAGGCRPPGRMPVDWVVATADVQFSDYWLDESTIARRISDHFFISATATMGAAG